MFCSQPVHGSSSCGRTILGTWFGSHPRRTPSKGSRRQITRSRALRIMSLIAIILHTKRTQTTDSMQIFGGPCAQSRILLQRHTTVARANIHICPSITSPPASDCGPHPQATATRGISISQRGLHLKVSEQLGPRSVRVVCGFKGWENR